MKKRILFALSSLKVTLPISIILLTVIFVAGSITKTSGYLPEPWQLIILVLASGIPPITFILRLITNSKIRLVR